MRVFHCIPTVSYFLFLVFLMDIMMISSKVAAITPYYKQTQASTPQPPPPAEMDISVDEPQKNRSKQKDTDHALLDNSCDSSCYINRISSSKNLTLTLLCGSDGFTYLNFEELLCVRKSCGKDIKLRSYGRCPRQPISNDDSPTNPLVPPTTPVMTTGSGNNGYNNGRDKKFLQFLSQNYAHMQEKPLAFPEKSQPAYSRRRPPAQTSFNMIPSYAIRKSSKKVICLPEECNCDDDESPFQPICASDSVTYGSQCLMDCSKECKPDLVKFHDGYCGKPFMHKRYGKQRCSLKECNCPEEQYDDDDGIPQVCGTNGLTYGSRCLLECNKSCSPDLQLSHNGYCGRLIFPSHPM